MKYILTLLFFINLYSEDHKQLLFFIDSYYAYDNSNFSKNIRPYFTQPRYEDSLNINLVQLGAEFKTIKFRSKLVAQAGNSVDSNYIAESNYNFRYIQEGFIGYSIDKDTVIDAGIFLSHIGLESFISRDNVTLTRSLVAEYSPYYQAGLRLTHNFNSKLSGQFHLLNGWQNISDDRHPAIGTQIKYQYYKTTFIYNTFLGDESNSNRIFNDFIITHEFNDKFNYGIQYDLGLQRKDETYKSWNGIAVIGQYKIFDKTKLGFRLEKYSDPNQIIISTNSLKSFRGYGYSINLDQNLLEKLVRRNEIRKIYAKDDVFEFVEESSKQNTLFVSSLQYSLN